MKKLRRPTEDLLFRIQSRGFTPGARDIPLLLERLENEVDDDTIKRIMSALMRAGQAVYPPLKERLPASMRPGRGRLTELAGKLAAKSPSNDLNELLLSLVRDEDLKTQLSAISALGRCKIAGSEAVLLQLLEGHPRPEVNRTLLKSLAKLGASQVSEAIVNASEAAADRGLKKAQLILRREVSRKAAGGIAAAVPMDADQIVWLSCRRGLESLLLEEAKAAGLTNLKIVAEGLVVASGLGNLQSLWQLRLALQFSLPLRLSADGMTFAQAFANQLSSQKTRSILRQLTLGPLRYRLNLPKLTRAEIWTLAANITDQCPELINDPTKSVWEFGVRVIDTSSYLELIPKGWSDPRFSYRQTDVPAASHPTIAAALARVARVEPGDIVWDPFVGSGSELIECWRLAAPHKLYGTDLSEKALEAAKLNAQAAGIGEQLLLSHADCLDWQGARPTLIITNPPMGRRVSRGSLKDLFERLMPKLADQLAAGGRLVWLSPLPEHTRIKLSELGLKLGYAQLVDLGGFDAELQVWGKGRLPLTP